MAFKIKFLPADFQFISLGLPCALVLVLLQPLKLPFFLLPLVCFILAAPGALFLGWKGGGMMLALGLFSLVSNFQYDRGSRLDFPFPPERIRRVEGTLLAEPRWTEGGQVALSLEVQGVQDDRGCMASASGQIRVYLSGKEGAFAGDWMAGDALALQGRLKKSKRSGRYYFPARRLLHYTCLGPQSLRRRVHQALEHKAALLGGASRSLLPALVLGMQDQDFEVSAALFRETGSAHIIALSGFHSGLAALLLFWIFRLLFGYRPALVLSGCGLVVYLFMAGMRPSLFRAVLMYLILAGGRLFYRRWNLRRVLLFSYFITALIMPVSLHSLSARLSYLALWGILYTGPLVKNLIPRSCPSFLSLALSASAGAQIWTLPLVLSFFGLWYPVGLAASLVLTPLVSFYMYGGILYLFLPSFLSLPAVWFCRLLEKILMGSASLFRLVPPWQPEWISAKGGQGLFLFLLFPVLWALLYRPGGWSGQGASGLKLRFNFRNKNSSGDDGPGPPQALGTEFSH